MGDPTLAQQHLVAIFESDAANTPDVAQVPYEVNMTWQKTATDVNGTDTTAEFVLGFLPRNAYLVGCKYVPTAALNIDVNAGNFATFTLQSRGGNVAGAANINGANTQNLAVMTTKPTANSGTGNWTAWNVVDLGINAPDPANNFIIGGGAVTFKIGKTNGTANTVIPAGTLTARFRYF